MNNSKIIIETKFTPGREESVKKFEKEDAADAVIFSADEGAKITSEIILSSHKKTVIENCLSSVKKSVPKNSDLNFVQRNCYEIP